MFEEKEIQPLWGINNDGIGLVGTVVARNTPKDHIIHYVQELDNILNNFKLKSLLSFANFVYSDSAFIYKVL